MPDDKLNGVNCSSLSADLNVNMQNINQTFKNCSDLTISEFTITGSNLKCFYAFFEGTINNELLSDNVLKPLMSGIRNYLPEGQQDMSVLIKTIKESTISLSDVEEIGSLDEAVLEILNGACTLFIDNCSTALVLHIRSIESRKVDKPENEPAVAGPAEAFVENIIVNTALIRKRIKTPELKIEKLTVGRVSQSIVAICYINGLADGSVVEEVRQRIGRIDADILMDSRNIDQFIEDSPFSPFPQAEFTERPDSSVFALSDGRIAILVDGSPFAMIVPVVISNFIVSVEDNYSRGYFAPFMIVLRYFSFFISLLVPSMYIAITTFHQEMIPYQLLVTIASSRAQVPFSAFMEAFMMEGTFELLREASERLPKGLSQSLSIVGAIVVGQAAVQAGLVSPSMVVVLSVTAMASFVHPKINMSRTIRVIRFPLMIMAASLGMFGIIMGILTILIHMASLRSYGVCYLSPFTPMKIKDWKREVFNLSYRFADTRPSYIQENNIVRANKNSLSNPPENKN